MAAALTPLVDSLVSGWLRHDLQVRSRLIFNSVEESLPNLLSVAPRRGLKALFTAIAKTENILAVGWCSPSGSLETMSDDWPTESISCQKQGAAPVQFRVQRWSHGRILYAGFAVVEDATGWDNWSFSTI